MYPRWRGQLPFAAVLLALTLVAAACGGSDGSTGDTPAASAGPTSPAPTGSPLVIGTVGQYSGFAGTTSKATADGLEAWARLTNDRGGINGHPVRVVVKDDQNDPAKALAAVRGLVENDKVIALVGLHESGLESAWQSYVDAKKIPVIGGSMTGPVWTTDANFFPAGQTVPNYVAVETYAAKLAGKKKMGIIVCAEVPACAQGIPTTQRIAGTLGLQFAAGVGVSASSPNYTSQCLNMRGAGVEAIVLNTAQETSRRFAADCARQNYRPVFISPGQSFTTNLLQDTNYNGAYIASDAFNWVGDAPYAKDYLSAMKAYKPDTPLNASGSAGWAAGVMFGRAAAKVGANPTAADIYTGLYAQPAKNTLDGMIPATTFTRGKPAVVQPCGWYAQIKGGKLTTPQGAAAVCIASK